MIHSKNHNKTAPKPHKNVSVKDGSLEVTSMLQEETKDIVDNPAADSDTFLSSLQKSTSKPLVSHRVRTHSTADEQPAHMPGLDEQDDETAESNDDNANERHLSTEEKIKDEIAKGQEHHEESGKAYMHEGDHRDGYVHAKELTAATHKQVVVDEHKDELQKEHKIQHQAERENKTRDFLRHLKAVLNVKITFKKLRMDLVSAIRRNFMFLEQKTMRVKEAFNRAEKEHKRLERGRRVSSYAHHTIRRPGNQPGTFDDRTEKSKKENKKETKKHIKGDPILEEHKTNKKDLGHFTHDAISVKKTGGGPGLTH